MDLKAAGEALRLQVERQRAGQLSLDDAFQDLDAETRLQGLGADVRRKLIPIKMKDTLIFTMFRFFFEPQGGSRRSFQNLDDNC